MIAYANEVVILNGGKNMSRVKSNGPCINPRETELSHYERHRSVIFDRGKISQTDSGLGSLNTHLLMSNMVTSSEKQGSANYTILDLPALYMVVKCMVTKSRVKNGCILYQGVKNSSGTDTSMLEV